MAVEWYVTQSNSLDIKPAVFSSKAPGIVPIPKISRFRISQFIDFRRQRISSKTNKEDARAAGPFVCKLECSGRGRGLACGLQDRQPSGTWPAPSNRSAGKESPPLWLRLTDDTQQKERPISGPFVTNVEIKGSAHTKGNSKFFNLKIQEIISSFWGILFKHLLNCYFIKRRKKLGRIFATLIPDFERTI